MEITYNGNKVERRFTTGWGELDTIKAEGIVLVINSLIAQRKAMAEYIEALHNEIDSIHTKLDNSVRQIDIQIKTIKALTKIHESNT